MFPSQRAFSGHPYSTKTNIVITVFFRYDDYSAVSPSEVDMGVIDIMRRRGLCCTFAVIPAVTTGDYHHAGERDEIVLRGEKLELLKRAMDDGVVDLALHGWNHRADAAPPPMPSEFRGLSVEQQIGRIRRGYEFFKQQTGCAPAVFVPPWNTYDINTLRALEMVGIGAISAHRYSPVFEASTTRYVPMTIEIPELRTAIERAREGSDPDPIIGVMFHPYDFRESGDARGWITLAELERELAWLTQCEDVSVKSIGTLAASNRALDARRFRDNRPSAWETAFPPFVTRTYQIPVYMSAAPARRARGRRVVATSAFYVAVAVLVSIFVSTLATPYVGDEGKLFMQVAAVLLAAVFLIRGIITKGFYFRGVTLLSGMVGLCLGLVV
jgi:peptidoglycan/xylan/chitin deacetylase (PgdA/CDA1 family)